MEKESAIRITQLEDATRKEHNELERLKISYAEDKNTLMSEYKRQIERMDSHINEKTEAVERLTRRIEVKTREYDQVVVKNAEQSD